MLERRAFALPAFPNHNKEIFTWEPSAQVCQAWHDRNYPRSRYEFIVTLGFLRPDEVGPQREVQEQAQAIKVAVDFPCWPSLCRSVVLCKCKLPPPA